MDWFAGLIGAIIGGVCSLQATSMQLRKQDKDLKSLRVEEVNNAVAIIKSFLIHEIKLNLGDMKWLEPYFALEYGSKEHKSIFNKRDLSFVEYEKVKYKLLEINTIEMLEVIEIYAMFKMFLGHKNREHLSDFSEAEFNYIVHRYKSGNDIVEKYFEE